MDFISHLRIKKSNLNEYNNNECNNNENNRFFSILDILSMNEK